MRLIDVGLILIAEQIGVTKSCFCCFSAEMIWFGVERSKVKVTGSVSAVFTVISGA